MWNFAYPYKLKQLIDLACQRRMLFAYDGTEYGPLLKTPRPFVVYRGAGLRGRLADARFPVRPSDRIH